MIKTRALNSLVIVMRNADENSEIGSAFEIEDESGVFDRLPCGLEEETMFRIHILRFPRRDTKKLWVELVDGVSKSEKQGDGRVSHARFSIIISLNFPAIGWQFHDAFSGYDQTVPR